MYDFHSRINTNTLDYQKLLRGQFQSGNDICPHKNRLFSLCSGADSAPTGTPGSHPDTALKACGRAAHKESQQYSLFYILIIQRNGLIALQLIKQEEKDWSLELLVHSRIHFLCHCHCHCTK